MSKHEFTVVFDGPSVKGSIDAKELALSLLALSEMFQEANRLLNTPKSSVCVKVRADFMEGSFEINFEIVQSIVDRILSFLPVEKVYSARDIAELLGFGIFVIHTTKKMGLFELLKVINGKTYQIKKGSSGKLKIVTNDSEFELEDAGLKLFESPKIREEIFQFLKPLEKNGLEKIEIKENEQSVTTVNKDDLDSYKSINHQEELASVYTVEKICEVRSLSFDKDLSWKLFDGENKFTAKMCDEDFHESIENEDISFRKGDQFRMEIKTSQFRNNKGELKSTHEIVKVISKCDVHEQLQFNFDE